MMVACFSETLASTYKTNGVTTQKSINHNIKNNNKELNNPNRHQNLYDITISGQGNKAIRLQRK
jgi:hypothetical protein